MLWLDLKTYKTLPKAAKYYGQERRNGLLHFQSNPENSSQISFVFVKSAFSVKIEKWWQDHVTGLRRLRIPWYQHEPRQQRALSTTLQNGFLIISLNTCQEPSFFLCFSPWQKNWGKCLLFTASQDQVEISQHWKMVNYTQSAQFAKKLFEIFLTSGIEFFGLNFRQFQATQKFTESVLRGT